MPRRRAVVFAYHNIGVRCLKVLLAYQVDVVLIVSHQDSPQENIWFSSVTQFSNERGLPCITPHSLHDEAITQQIIDLAPDLIFSFYYRQMIPMPILACAKIGAFNMHGSLLPKYRGRAPVNWAILHGEKETGATLHEMHAKPDAGAIIHQTVVPILPDDIASEVFNKVNVAAEIALWQALPALLAGNVQRLPNRIEMGSYFGERRPEDGRIDWSQPTQVIYNLYRAVAPPYPGAFTEIGGHRLVLSHAQLIETPSELAKAPCGLHVFDNRIFGIGGDGRCIAISALTLLGQPFSTARLETLLTVHRSQK